MIYRTIGKRLFDLALTVPALLILAVPFTLLAWLVRVKLGSPVFFRQQRPGLKGRAFTMLKFRTMIDANDASGNPLPDAQRATDFGNWLRRTSLDELPELWNVLKGEMSLVGPRPLLMRYLPRYTPEQMRRHDARPGITGLAQINGRNEVPWVEKFVIDVDYVDRCSFLLDLQILIGTVRTVFSAEGVSMKDHFSSTEFLGTEAPDFGGEKRMIALSPSPQIDILDVSQTERWLGVLGECPAHDFYHLPGYHALAERRGEGTPRLFVYRDEEGVIALPLLLRPLATVPGLEEIGCGWCDANSVYGYPGPIASCEVPGAESVRGFQEALETKLRKLRVVSLFSRLHPLLPQRDLVTGLGDYMPSGTTVSIDLTLSLAEQRQRMRSEYRRAAQKAREQDFVVVEDRERTHLARFVEIYRENMQRVDASDYYFFDRAYFDELLASLGDAARLFVVLANGEVACGALFIFSGDIVQYHLGGSAEKFLRSAPMKLLLDEVRIAATEEGRKIFHLGGGLGGQRDSLFQFKSGFSDRTHEFAVWRWILNAERYNALTHARLRWSQREHRMLTGGDFFPLYRATARAGNTDIL